MGVSRPDRIDPEVAHQYLLEGKAQFVDARPPASYERAAYRIPGAIHVPPGSGAAMDAMLEALPREKLIVAYCDEPNQAASVQIAERARKLTLGDVSVLEGGFTAWCEAGLDLEPTPHFDHVLRSPPAH